jgi:hypothetical protein
MKASGDFILDIAALAGVGASAVLDVEYAASPVAVGMGRFGRFCWGMELLLLGAMKDHVRGELSSRS